jgi:hypothetical protein
MPVDDSLDRDAVDHLGPRKPRIDPQFNDHLVTDALRVARVSSAPTRYSRRDTRMDAVAPGWGP